MASFVLYFSWIDALKTLDSAAAWGVVVAMSEFSQFGDEPTKLSREQQLVWKIVLPILEANRERYTNKIQQTSEAGRASGQARRNKTGLPSSERMNIPVERVGTDVPGVERPFPNKNIDTNSNSNRDNMGIKIPPKNTAAVLPAGDLPFEELWNAYPEQRRGNRSFARSAYNKAIGDDPAKHKQAIASVEQWKRSEKWLKEGGQYIPKLENWLAFDSWECPPPPISGGKVQASGDYYRAPEVESVKQLLADKSLDEWCRNNPEVI